MKIKLISDVNQAWRFAVMWVQGIGASVMGAWMLIDDAQRAALLDLVGIPADRLLAITALVVFIGGMGARIVKQDLPKP